MVGWNAANIRMGEKKKVCDPHGKRPDVPNSLPLLIWNRQEGKQQQLQQPKKKKKKKSSDWKFKNLVHFLGERWKVNPVSRLGVFGTQPSLAHFSSLNEPGIYLLLWKPTSRHHAAHFHIFNWIFKLHGCIRCQIGIKWWAIRRPIWRPWPTEIQMKTPWAFSF